MTSHHVREHTRRSVLTGAAPVSRNATRPGHDYRRSGDESSARKCGHSFCVPPGARALPFQKTEDRPVELVRFLIKQGSRLRGDFQFRRGGERRHGRLGELTAFRCGRGASTPKENWTVSAPFLHRFQNSSGPFFPRQPSQTNAKIDAPWKSGTARTDSSL